VGCAIVLRMGESLSYAGFLRRRGWNRVSARKKNRDLILRRVAPKKMPCGTVRVPQGCKKISGYFCLMSTD